MHSPGWWVEARARQPDSVFGRAALWLSRLPLDRLQRPAGLAANRRAGLAEARRAADVRGTDRRAGRAHLHRRATSSWPDDVSWRRTKRLRTREASGRQSG